MGNKFHLKQISDTNWTISLSAKKIGFVRGEDGEFFGRMKVCDGTEQTAKASTCIDCFNELVAINNRISLCGKNDIQSAKIALDRRNEKTLKENSDRHNELLELWKDDPEMLAILSEAKQKVKSTKIRI